MTYTMTYGKQGTITIDTTNGIISGNTYAWKNDIKNWFDGITWDKANKVWTMAGDQMQAIIDAAYDWYVRAVNLTKVGGDEELNEANAETTIEDTTETTTATATETATASATISTATTRKTTRTYTTAGTTKPCRKCGTYCGGSCHL